MSTNRIPFSRVAIILGRTLLLLTIIESINEFGVAGLLHRYGVQFGSVKIYVVKSISFILMTTIIIILFIWKDFRRLQDTQRQLRQSEKDKEHLFEANPDGICMMDVRGRFSYANKAFLDFVGHDIQSLRQLPSHPFLSEENRETILMNFNKALEGSTVRFRTTIRWPSGGEHLLEMLYVPSYTLGQVTSIYIILKDITDLIMTTRKLHETQNYLDSLVEHSSDAILIFTSELNVLRINPSFELLYGWTAEELVGNPIPTKLFFRGHYYEFIELTQKTLQGQAVTGFEAVNFTKSGKKLDVSLSVSPVKDETGKIVAMASISRDISAQKQMIAELQRKTDLLNSLFKYAGDAISLLDTEGHIQYANPAWENLFGWRLQEVIGQRSPTLSHGNRLREVIEEGKIFVAEQRDKQRKDGRAVFVSVTVSPTYDQFGKVTGAVFIHKDLTAAKIAAEQADRNERLAIVAELAASVGHEIRNPLTSIKGFLQLMQTSHHPNHLDILLDEVQRISDITDELLLLAKPQAGIMCKESLSKILDEVLALMAAQANMASVSIRVDYKRTEPEITGVKSQLKQVFINIIKNAIEASLPGGEVHVKVHSYSDKVCVFISDNGVGIPEEDMVSLGQPFYTTKSQGTGLGLMVTYRIVEQHGGSIQVTSAVGKGSTFNICFPLPRT